MTTGILAYCENGHTRKTNFASKPWHPPHHPPVGLVKRGAQLQRNCENACWAGRGKVCVQGVAHMSVAIPCLWTTPAPRSAHCRR